MAQCEMCGRDSELVDAIVEGTMLSVCKNCAKFGHVLEIRKPVEVERPRTIEVHRTIPVEDEVEVIVSDYSMLVRKAREKKGMKQEELAKAIAEKESVINKVEAGHMEPPFNLAKKLEQFLGINLITTAKETYEKKTFNINDTNLTIGDLLRMKKPTSK